MTLADFAAQTAAGAFETVFDPFGAKQTTADTLKDEQQRKQERHEQELSLKEQQIKQAKIKTALAEDSKKNAALMQKFNMRNQDPEVAAEMYNSMGFGDEMQFDVSHFESTASGGKRQAVEPSASMAGTTEDRLKPDSERAGALVGASDGEYRFKTGYYKRDDKGQKILGKDGKPLFVETGAPTIYKNKKEMIDDVSKMQDPKLRAAMALKELGIDEFVKKTDIKTAAAKEIGTLTHQQRIEQIKASGEEQQKTARIYGDSKATAAAGTRGSMTEAQKATDERMRIDDKRKSITNEVRQVIDPNGENTGQLFDRDETKDIMKLTGSKAYKEGIARLRNYPKERVKKELNELYKNFKDATGRDVPKVYKEFLMKQAMAGNKPTKE